MNYHKLKEAVEKAVAIGDVDYLLSLMTVANARTVALQKQSAVSQSRFFTSIRKALPPLSKLTEDELVTVFDPSVSQNTKAELFKKRGLKFPDPDKADIEKLLKKDR